MALFDFLFGSEERSNLDTQGTGTMRTTGNVVNKTTTMVCTASIVMKKMIFEIRMPFSAEATPSVSSEGRSGDCGDPSDDGMSGFDIYEDNDF